MAWKSVTGWISALVIGATAGYLGPQVGTQDIKDNAVTSAKIATNAVATSKIASPEIRALAGISSDVDKIPYFSQPFVMSVTDYTDFARALDAQVSDGGARLTMGLRAITAYAWAMPSDTSQDIWTERCVVPGVRVKVNQHSYKPPGDATTYPDTPQGSADLTSSWVNYYTTVFQGKGREYTGYPVTVMDWGAPNASDYFTDPTNSYALCRNWRDRVDIFGGFTGLTADQKIKDCNTYYDDWGIALNRDWTTQYMAQLATHHNVRPSWWMMDTEDGVSPDYLLPDPNAWSAQATENDWRYGYVLVDGYQTLRAAFGNASVDLDTSLTIYDPFNHDFLNFIGNLSKREFAWAFKKAFIEPAASYYPDVRVGEFDIYSAADKQRVQNGRANYEFYDISLPDSHYMQQPVCYPMGDLDFQGFGSSLTDQCNKWGVTGSTNAEKYWNVNLAKFRGALKSIRGANPNAKIVPWMPFVGQTSNLPTLGIATFTLDTTKLIQLYQIAIDNGCREFSQFAPSTGMLDTDGTHLQMYSDTLDAIKNANAYASGIDVQPQEVVQRPLAKMDPILREEAGIMHGQAANAVADFGADPSGNTNSTAALQRAFNAAADGAYHGVYVPAGRYMVTPGQLYWPNKISSFIVGAGGIGDTNPQPNRGTTIFSDGTQPDKPLLNVDGGGGLHIADIAFWGNNAVNGSGGATLTGAARGVRWQDVNNDGIGAGSGMLERVSFQWCSVGFDIGFVALGDTEHTINSCDSYLLNQVLFWNCAYGSRTNQDQNVVFVYNQCSWIGSTGNTNVAIDAVKGGDIVVNNLSTYGIDTVLKVTSGGVSNSFVFNGGHIDNDGHKRTKLYFADTVVNPAWTVFESVEANPLGLDVVSGGPCVTTVTGHQVTLRNCNNLGSANGAVFKLAGGGNVIVDHCTIPSTTSQVLDATSSGGSYRVKDCINAATGAFIDTYGSSLDGTYVPTTRTVNGFPLSGDLSQSQLLPTQTGNANKVLLTNGSAASWNTVVTSVGLSLPGEFSVSNSPVTSTGTLTGSWATQTANTVFSGPTSGLATTPTFRSLVPNDIPSLDASKINSGALLMARGGTGVDLSASGGTTKILAQDASHVISARDLVAADIPNLAASKITSGTLALAQGGTNADLSATGGTSRVLKQTSSGAAITVAQLAASDLSNGTTGSGGGVVLATGPTISGGSISALTGLGIRSTGSGAFDLTLANSENLTAGRTLTLKLNDAARALSLTGDATITGTNTGDQTITLTGNVTGSGTGSFATTIANSAVTNAMLAGSIDLTTKVTGVLPIANGGTNTTTGAADGWTTLVVAAPETSNSNGAAGGTASTYLTFNVTANHPYIVEGLVAFSGNATDDASWILVTGTGNMTGRGNSQTLGSALTVTSLIVVAAGATSTTAMTVGCDGTADVPTPCWFTYTFKPASTTTVTFKFGEAANGGNTAKLHTGSRMRYRDAS